jgi:hypothetical protein
MYLYFKHILILILIIQIFGIGKHADWITNQSIWFSRDQTVKFHLYIYIDMHIRLTNDYHLVIKMIEKLRQWQI